jgi:hypothetical protein
MTPKSITLEPFTEGDGFPGIPLVTITVGPTGGPYAPPASALALVTMRFSKADGTAEVVELSSATDKIEITDDAGWIFSVPKQVVPGLTAGRWNWRIRCTDATGMPDTYLAGQVNVLETV